MVGGYNGTGTLCIFVQVSSYLGVVRVDMTFIIGVFGSGVFK